jgi:hypothetical protein
MYILDNFLEPLTPTGNFLVLRNEFGNIKTRINPLHVKLMYVNKSILNIDTNTLNLIQLEFSNNTICKLALRKINLIIDLLKSRNKTSKSVYIEKTFNDFVIDNIDITNTHYPTGLILDSKPNENSYILVFLNGQEIELSTTGNKDDAPTYFSSDGGVTAKDLTTNPVEIGDELYWNRSYPDYPIDLENGSRISLYYLTER